MLSVTDRGQGQDGDLETVCSLGMARKLIRAEVAPSLFDHDQAAKIALFRALTRSIGNLRRCLGYIRRGERIDHFETVRQRKHGGLIVVSLTISPVKNAEGEIVGASKIARDITEQKRSQELITTLARRAVLDGLFTTILVLYFLLVAGEVFLRRIVDVVEPASLGVSNEQP